MKKLITIILLIAAGQAMATDYYFSSSTGNDISGAGTQLSPWASLTKAQTVATTGNRLYFKRGDTFTGSIVMQGSGTSDTRILIDAYGTGAKPIITGFSTLSTWTNISGNIWETTSAASTLSTCNIASIGGANLAKGRMPKTGYWTIGTTNGTTTITDATNISTSVVSAGADAVVRELMYEVNNRVISNVSGNTITFASGSPATGWGYFLQNDVKLCTQANEWYYNTSTKKFGIYSSGSPSNVKIPTVETGINLNSKTSVTISNLQITGYNTYGVNTTSSSNITVTNCDFSFIGSDGIYAYPNSANLSVSNSTFTDCGSRGIHAGSSDAAVISGNTLLRIGHYAGMGTNGDDSYTGIIVNGDNSMCSDNSVIRAGYCGIRWDGEATAIQRNFVDTTNYVKDDGGGIYSYQVQYGNNQHVWPSKRIIRDNIVLNSLGAGAGSPFGNEGYGFYFDGQSCDFDVKHNTTANNSKAGIFVNGGARFNIDSNTVYNSSRQIYVIKIGGNITDISVNYNIFVAKEATQYAAYYEPGAASMPASFAANNNVYARPVDDDNTIWVDFNGTNNYYTLAQWKTVSGQDAASTKSPIAVSSTAKLRIDYNNTSSETAVYLPSIYKDMKDNIYPGVAIIPPYSSKVLAEYAAIPDETPLILNVHIEND